MAKGNHNIQTQTIFKKSLSYNVVLLTLRIVFCSVPAHTPWQLVALLQVSLPCLQPLWPVKCGVGEKDDFFKHRRPPCECLKQGRRSWQTASAGVFLLLTALALVLVLLPRRQFSVIINFWRVWCLSNSQCISPLWKCLSWLWWRVFFRGCPGLLSPVHPLPFWLRCLPLSAPPCSWTQSQPSPGRPTNGLTINL